MATRKKSIRAKRSHVAQALKAGTKVRLRSGGPLMTIVKTQRNMAHCVWFPTARIGKEDRFEAMCEVCTFPVECLEVVQ